MEEKFNLTTLFQTLEMISSIPNPTTTDLRSEWKFSCIEVVDEPETCLCGHYPIINVCIMDHKTENRTIRVGNVCVNKFFGDDYSFLFADLKKLSKDISSSISLKTIDHVFSCGGITETDYSIIRSLRNKRKIHEYAIAHKKEVNKKIVNFIQGDMKITKEGKEYRDSLINLNKQIDEVKRINR